MYVLTCVALTILKHYVYRGKSPITDPVSYLSNYKRDHKIIYMKQFNDKYE